MFDAAAQMVIFAKQEAEDAAKGVMDLFADAGGSRKLDLPPSRAWSHAERCAAEHAAVGYYMTEHPLDQHRAALTAAGVQPRRKVERLAGSGKAPCRIAGVVIAVKERVSKKGNPFAILTLSDEAGQTEAIAFEDAIEMSRGMLSPGAIVVCDATAHIEGDGAKYLIRGIISMADALSAKDAPRARSRR